jgi:3-oxoacyl-[acyl-carrier-protein] synthase-3
MITVIDDIQIRAITAWLPQEQLKLSELSKIYGESEVKNIIKATGIERVRVAEDDETSSDMCCHAAEYLVEQEQLEKASIDGMVFVSQTPDYILPATSINLQYRLGLSTDVVCMDIHYGCSGYIYGLFQAASWIHCGACNNVLVLAGDTTSRMINPNDKSLRMVFGDCGTATWITKGNTPMGIHIQSDGSGADSLIVPAGGFRTPTSEVTSHLVWDNDGNGRTQNDLFMDGAEIFNFAISNVHKNIYSLLDRMLWSKENVGLFALHQANDFMVNYIRKKLKVPAELVPTNVRNYGNTGPATIPLLLCEINAQSDYDLNKVIMSGFGVGLSWGSIATNLTETNFYPPLNK